MLAKPLVDDLGVAAFGHFSLNERAMWLANAAARRHGFADFDLGCRVVRVGGHFGPSGRFCRQDAGFAAAPRDRLTAMAGFSFNPPPRPAQTQSKDRFSCRHAQLIHGGAFAPRASGPTVA